MTTSTTNEKREQLVFLVPLNTIFVAHMKEIMDFEYEGNYGLFSQQQKNRLADIGNISFDEFFRSILIRIHIIIHIPNKLTQLYSLVCSAGQCLISRCMFNHHANCLGRLTV